MREAYSSDLPLGHICFIFRPVANTRNFFVETSRLPETRAPVPNATSSREPDESIGNILQTNSAERDISRS